MTRALIAVIRKRATIGHGTSNGIRFVQIRSEEGNTLILKDDWAKILPFIQDGTFDPLVTPPAECVSYINPAVSHGESVLDQADRLLFGKILGTLKLVFTDSFPTSQL